MTAPVIQGSVIQGPVIQGPIIQGWCPGALRPMLSGDGHVVRVRPRGGRLTPDQAAGIARAALAHGNGLIDLSARANVQLRGVTEASHAALIADLRALDLIDASAEAEARRNIVVTPFWAAGDGTEGLARELAAALAAADAPALPGKFGFAIDTGPAPVLHDTSADIRIEVAGGGLIVRADGAAWGAGATLETAVPLALDLARWFVASGGVQGGRGRMAAHLARGAIPPAPFGEIGAAAPAAPPGPGLVAAGALVGFDFGQMQAETLAGLAGLGALRVTPWRMLLVEGATRLPDLPGLITRAGDPMLRVVACTGKPGCLQARQPTRDLARSLAPQVPAGAILHVSGCAKGCALPGPAAFTLVAQTDGFGVIRGGSAAEPPLAVHSPADLSATPDLIFGTP